MLVTTIYQVLEYNVKLEVNIVTGSGAENCPSRLVLVAMMRPTCVGPDRRTGLKSRWRLPGRRAKITKTAPWDSHRQKSQWFCSSSRGLQTVQRLRADPREFIENLFVDGTMAAYQGASRPFCLHAGFAATLATPVRLGTSASLLVRMTSPRGPFYRTGDDSCLLCDKSYS